MLRRTNREGSSKRTRRHARRALLATVALAFGLALAPGWASASAFLTMDGIPGDAPPPAPPGSMEILSFSPLNENEMAIARIPDASSPDIQIALVNGTPIGFVRLEVFYPLYSDIHPTYTYLFHDVQITSYSIDSAGESFSLSFATLEISTGPPFDRLDLFDGTFESGDWSTSAITTGGATHSVEAVTSGGDPGDYRRMEHFVPGVASVEVFHRYDAEVFVPASQGPIAFVSYSEDRIEYDPPFSGAQIGSLPALEQGGVLYRGPIANFSNTSWETMTVVDLTSVDFDDGAGGHPDFTVAGGPIRFGYIRRNSSTNSGSTHTLVSGIDDFTVRVFYERILEVETIADDTFDDADWAVVVTGATGSATQSVSFISTGGSPGSYRKLKHTIPGASSIEVFHGFLGATWDPSVDGEIVEVDYSEDRIELDPPFSGAAVGAAPALMQDGIVYVGPSASYTSLVWESLFLSSLTASEFDDGMGGHPDFSSQGTQIVFGFVRSNWSSVPGTSYTITSGIDNWSYDLLHVPEPTSALAFGCGCGVLYLLRRHRQSRRSRRPRSWDALPPSDPE